MIIIVTLTLGVAVTVGYVGYLAFGNNTKSIILYNLPNEDPWAITAEICYIVTLAGSFVLIIQPIFHIVEQSNIYRYGSFHSPAERIDLPPAQNDTPFAQDEIQVENQFCKKEASSDDVTERQPQEMDEEFDYSPSGIVKFYTIRLTIVLTVMIFSVLIPNISILITFAGALLGTIFNIWLPVLFYNRAYNSSEKNIALNRMRTPL